MNALVQPPGPCASGGSVYSGFTSRLLAVSGFECWLLGFVLSDFGSWESLLPQFGNYRIVV